MFRVRCDMDPVDRDKEVVGGEQVDKQGTKKTQNGFLQTVSTFVIYA